MRRWSFGRRVAWWSGVVGSAAGTYVLGRGRLPTPPVASPGRWPGWWERLGPVVATFSLLRIAILAGAAYLVLLGCMAAATYWLRRPGLWSVLRWLGPPGPRRLVLASLGIAGTLSVLAGSNGVALAAPHSGHGSAGEGGGSAPVLRLIRPSPPVLRLRPPPGGSSAGTGNVRRVSTPPATQDPVPPAAPNRAPTPPPNPPPTPAPRTAGPPLRGQPDAWVVRPGDSLWSIAAATIATRAGTEDPQVIARYWWRVVEANRPHLPNPNDPDLIFPGDVVALPTLG